MAIYKPQFDMQTAAGGFMEKIFNNLPKPFRRDPKPQEILQLTPSGTPKYPYISIADSMLHLHTQPLRTPAYTPEVSFSLGDYSVASLAAAITAGGYGYTASALGSQDGNTAVLLLGFIDERLNGVDTFRVSIATARSWKIFYPIAQALYGAEQTISYAENALLMPFARGFWLDFWGDWLNIPRLPGMNDFDYVTYLIRTLRLPKVNNKAMEDILTAKYGVPAEIVDSGYKQFTANLDASLMPYGQETIRLINEIKAAGVRWLAVYYSRNSEDFKAYFYDKSGGKEFKNSDAFRIKLTMQEERYGYGPDVHGFLMNHDTFNNGDFGGGRRITDDLSLMSYLLNFDETMPPPSELSQISTATFRLSEKYKTPSDIVSRAAFGISIPEDQYGYTARGFMMGASTFNNDQIGMARKITEAKVEMFYNSRNDPSYTVL